MSEHQDAVQHVAKLVDRAKLCMFSTRTADGRILARPMALQDVEFDGDLWFFAYDDSNKAAQIRENPAVNVSFSNPKNSEWTSVSGAAEIVHDRTKAEEYWSPALKAWFPDGLDTAGLALVKVHADSAEFWESSSSKAVRLLGMARAAATGDPDKFPGTNDEVDLS